MESPNNSVPAGAATPQNNWGEYNSVAFAIQQALAKVQTATLVKIVACTNSGGVSPVGFVDVLPMVNQLDSRGKPTPHTTIYNLPYVRIQGGLDAIIIDPKVGDVGLAVFCSRDISKVKSTKSQSNPGSFRRYSFSDGVYIGGILNGAPKQFVQYHPSGINVATKTGAEGINLKAPVGNVTLKAGATTKLTLAKDGPISMSEKGGGGINVGVNGITSITDGKSTISLNGDGTVTITAPAGVLVTTPKATFSGDVEIQGNLKVDKDATVLGKLTATLA